MVYNSVSQSVARGPLVVREVTHNKSHFKYQFLNFCLQSVLLEELKKSLYCILIITEHFFGGGGYLESGGP